ncbi:MAG: inositol monophosphatase [Chloroflexi bacterium]|nr:inositol monophosphatase [Chloroflexota bacterium]
MAPPLSTTGKTALGVARLCAAAAREIMREAFGRAGVTAVKGRGNVLTETDMAVERVTHEILGREYPSHAILSEETAAEVRSDGWMWVVDPVDGTKNFSRGIPHFCYNIALCHESEPVTALTLQPLLDEEFAAEAGRGCTLNGTPVTVSGVETVRDSVFAMDMGYDDRRGRRQLETALSLWPGMQSLRVPGSAALGMAYVAAGRWDIFVHANMQPWDVAAGLLLVREAGGVVTGREGERATIYSEGVVAATPGVHADFLSLAGHRPWRA